MSTPKVVFTGHVCIDQNVVEGTQYTSWGSPSIFMAKYFQSALQLEPTIIASYGPDFLQFAEDLPLYPATPNLAQTLLYENIVTPEHRSWRCHHAQTNIPPVLDEAALAILADADILFFAPLTPFYSTAYVQQFTAAVPRSCLKVLLPQGYIRTISDDGQVTPRDFPEAPDIIPLFDIVTLSDDDHPEALRLAQRWQKASAHTHIIVTRNAKGADIIQPEGGSLHIPTNPVPPEEIIDSVGCGDVFTAATAYHLRATGDLEAAIKKGHVAARVKLLTPKS